MNRLIQAAKRGRVWNAYMIVGNPEQVHSVAKEFVGHLTQTPYEMQDTKMESIRALLTDVNIKPDEGKRKVYVLPTDQMSQRSQNALLKTLEEPPDYAVFVLLSSNFTIPLPTVKSRCVLYHCPAQSEEEIAQELQAAQVIHAPLCQRYGFGSSKKALTLAQDAGFLDRRNRVLQMVTDFLKNQLTPLTKEEKEAAPTYVLYMLLFLQDVLSPGEPHWHPDQAELIARCRQHFTSDQILGMIDEIKQADKLMHQNTNPQYVWDSMQVGLREVFHG